MKQPLWFGLAAALLGGGVPAAHAQVPAIVVADRVNVRSRPSVSRGEIVTQLAHDQKVILFEEGLPSASPKEPVTEWTRIELPAGSPVWVASDHVALPAGTVKVRRLNVRAGPSEDYAILGTVTQGATLRSLGQQNGWLKIEAPLGLSGYVASAFLRLADRPALHDAAPPPATSPAQTSPAPPATAPPQESVQPPATTSPAAEPGQAAPSPEAGVVTPTPAVSEVVEVSPVPRIVHREGVVRATFSVQAPTPFELEAADNGKLLNYLLPQSTNVLIRPFRGQRVRLTGEEYLEPRWANAPVIVVHEIKLAP